MKIIFFILLMECCVYSNCQTTLPSSRDLSNYCPSDTFQYRATCYAYAVVYSALSTEYNILHHITDKHTINTHYFSAGYIASYHNSTLSFLKRSPYCGRYGTADKSLDYLVTQGSVLASEYDCDCENFGQLDAKIPVTVKRQKIVGYEVLGVNNEFSNRAVDWIKSALYNNHPVIIAFFQNLEVYENDSSSINKMTVDEDTKKLIENSPSGLSNHVACIMGYDDTYSTGKGYFLMKNNFKGWGDGRGFAWIPYTYLTPLIQEAYFIQGLAK